jgi:hypothetical protein
MKSAKLKYSRACGNSQERLSERSELRADGGNPAKRAIPRGRKTTQIIARRTPMSNEEIRAQIWLDERLVKFYRRRNGLWPKLRRLFSRAV